MWLDEWLFRKKKTIVALARELNISRNYANMLVLKKKRAGERLARDIEALTEGAVSLKTLRDVKIK
jgi:predicted transcriptional regulator